MRSFISFSLIVVLASFCAFVRAADDAPAGATGTWTWSQPGRGGGAETTVSLKLKQDGAKLTGTVSGFQGAETEITDGKVDGNNITFKTVREFGGSKITSTYTFAMTGDALKGKVETVTSRDIEGKRSK